MKINEIMKQSVVSVMPEDTALTASRLLSRHNIGSLPVCTGDGRLQGIVTDRDIVLRCVASGRNPETTPVSDIMSTNVVSVSPTDEVSTAASLMSNEKIRRLPVVDKGRVAGMLSLGDIAKSRSFNMEAARALTDISSNVKKK
jgi:CBS domain-containing protein